MSDILSRFTTIIASSYGDSNAIILFLLFLLLIAYFTFYQTWADPYHLFPGPPSEHWFFGNVRALMGAETGAKQASWTKRYGPTLIYHSGYRRRNVMTIDYHAITFIHKHPQIFDRPPENQDAFRNVTGQSVLSATGDDHKRMRKIMAPAFGPVQIRDMVPSMFAKAYQVRDELLRTSHGGIIDAIDWMNKAAVDVIGTAGFGYEFGAVRSDRNEVLEKMKAMRAAQANRDFIGMLQSMGLPFTKHITFNRTKRTQLKAKEVMLRAAGRVVDDRQRLLSIPKDGDVKQSDFDGRDIMTLLLRGSMAKDLQPNQKLSEEEMISQIPALMLAANGTTGSALSWFMVVLATHPDIQQRLRVELAAVSDAEPDWNDLNDLPYLQAFTQELLRFHATAPTMTRQCFEDVAVPLSLPVKGKDGSLLTSISLKKGTRIHIPMLTINHAEEYFGPTADVFDPSRWLTPDGIPQQGKDIPGLWSNLPTFGGGERACIGWRFALAEIKVIIFVIVREMRVEEAGKPLLLERHGGLGVNKPKVVGSSDLKVPVRVSQLN